MGRLKSILFNGNMYLLGKHIGGSLLASCLPMWNLHLMGAVPLPKCYSLSDLLRNDATRGDGFQSRERLPAVVDAPYYFYPLVPLARPVRRSLIGKAY